MSDFQDEVERARDYFRLADGQSWGNWVFVEGDHTLVNKEEDYEIPLDDMADSAHMLDWICQIACKSWGTPEELGNLVKALNHIFRPQATLCGQGIHRKLDAKAFLQQRVKRP